MSFLGNPDHAHALQDLIAHTIMADTSSTLITYNNAMNGTHGLSPISAMTQQIMTCGSGKKTSPVTASW